MGKPLWKFLEDGGIDACLDYGLLPAIKVNANCCSWALGDLLHFYQRISLYCCGCGMYSNTNNLEYSVSTDYIKTRFTADLIANRAKFMGLGEEIPKVPDGYYLTAAFSSKKSYHFVRGHKCGTWTERSGGGKIIRSVHKNPESIKDLIESIDMEFREIFKGWFAIPNVGIQNGIDQAVYCIWKSRSLKRRRCLPEYLFRDLENMALFFKEKNHLMNNVIDLKTLEYNFRGLISECFEKRQPYQDYKAIENFLEKYNKVKLPEITNSPQRNLSYLLRQSSLVQNCLTTI